MKKKYVGDLFLTRCLLLCLFVLGITLFCHPKFAKDENFIRVLGGICILGVIRRISVYRAIHSEKDEK
jgi:hypothetical protein